MPQQPGPCICIWRRLSSNHQKLFGNVRAIVLGQKALSHQFTVLVAPDLPLDLPDARITPKKRDRLGAAAHDRPVKSRPSLLS